MFQILTTCQNDLNNCCTDYALAGYLDIIKQVINIVHIVVPIILIIMGIIKFSKMVVNPDDKKEYKQILNMAISAVLVFFIPYIMNLVISLLPDNKFDIAKCWEQSSEVAEKLK